jgi:hypothetical protein
MLSCMSMPPLGRATVIRKIQITKGASDNKLIRFIKHYIFGDEKEMLRLLTSEKQVQLLTQVYQDFWTQSENNSLHYPFPNVIGKYFS